MREAILRVRPETRREESVTARSAVTVARVTAAKFKGAIVSKSTSPMVSTSKCRQMLRANPLSVAKIVGAVVAPYDAREGASPARRINPYRRSRVAQFEASDVRTLDNRRSGGRHEGEKRRGEDCGSEHCDVAVRGFVLSLAVSRFGGMSSSEQKSISLDI